jgi:hypothetical protein
MPAQVVELFGPFLIPVALFVFGAAAYGVLVVLSRRGLLPRWVQSPESRGND